MYQIVHLLYNVDPQFASDRHPLHFSQTSVYHDLYLRWNCEQVLADMITDYAITPENHHFKSWIHFFFWKWLYLVYIFVCIVYCTRSPSYMPLVNDHNPIAIKTKLICCVIGQCGEGISLSHK